MLSTPEDLRKIGVDSQDESLQRRTTELNLISCDTVRAACFCMISFD